MSEDRRSVMGSEGVSLPMPVEIEDTDAEWLTAALGSQLPTGVAVRSFAVETIGTGVGLMGLLYRLTIEYVGDVDHAAPPTLIVKLPVLIDATREVALAYRFCEKEVAFYPELAEETSLRTPDVYFGAHDLDTDNFVLVMQDIDHLRAADQIAGCERDDVITVTHGDYRLDDPFFDEARTVTALDWQITTKGVGGYDFAYFVSQILSATD